MAVNTCDWTFTSKISAMPGTQNKRKLYASLNPFILYPLFSVKININPIIIAKSNAPTRDITTMFAVFLPFSVDFIHVDKMEIETLPNTNAAIPNKIAPPIKTTKAIAVPSAPPNASPKLDASWLGASFNNCCAPNKKKRVIKPNGAVNPAKTYATIFLFLFDYISIPSFISFIHYITFSFSFK